MISSFVFGISPDNTEVMGYTLTNISGMAVSLISIGAAVQKVTVPDHSGKAISVALSYNSLDHYLRTSTYSGSICGRVANRIGKASFTLNKTIYTLAKNDGFNQLHGGPDGFYSKIWDAEYTDHSVTFHMSSPDEDQGFPGEMNVHVTYTLTDDNTLAIDYTAVCNKDTLCNLTNHTYWNLLGYGEGDALSQNIQIDADFYTPINEETLPTGEISPVTGPFDLRSSKNICQGKLSTHSQIQLAGGYDHNFVLRNYIPNQLNRCAKLSDPASGRYMEVYSTMPGLQFFSGSWQKEGYTGVALETQYFPNAMEYWWFPSVILPKNQPYSSRTEYRFHF